MAFVLGNSQSKPTLEINATAESAIEDYRIVTWGNSSDVVKPATAATVIPLGVSKQAKDLHSTTNYATGYTVDIVVDGIAYIKMDGSGLRGNPVIATTGGKGTKVTFNSADQYCIGIALKNWNDGEICPVLIRFFHIGNVDAAS